MGYFWIMGLEREQSNVAKAAGIAGFFSSRVFALGGFISAHLLLIWLGLHGVATPMGDIIYAYQPWVQRMQETGEFFGLQLPWVYPWPNLLLVFVPAQFNIDYQAAWLIWSTAFSIAAASYLLWAKGFDSAKTARALWLWTATLVLLGPVSISRLDSFSVALSAVGVVAWLQNRRLFAVAVFAIGVWFKVWPIALLIAGFAALRGLRQRLNIVVVSLSVGVGILLIGLLLGGTPQALTSFVTGQTDRGIQIESPWAAFWLWAGALGSKDAGLYFDGPLQTFQVFGAGTQVFSALLGPVMYLALGITGILGLKAAAAQGSSGTTIGSEPVNRVFALVALTGVLDLIVFNKVGSPQYYGWLIVPLLFGYLAGVFKKPNLISWVLGIAALTGVVYPYIYDNILGLDAWAVAVLTLRNLAVVGLLVYCNLKLSELGKKPSSL